MIRWLSIREDGSVDRPGVETPKGTRVVKRENGTIVVKVPGHKYWTGVGMPFGYADARYEVYRVVNDSGVGSVEVERLTSFPVRS